MAEDIDELLTEIHSITQQLGDEGLSAGERRHLTHRKEALQKTARDLSLSGRHPIAVANQIESLERRKAFIEAQFIKPGYAEKRGGKNIQDPGAYSRNINLVLGEKYRTELDEIERQLRLLKPSDG